MEHRRGRWVRFVAVAVSAAAFAATSCRKPLTVGLDQPFTLHVGQAARLAKSDLDLYFRRVAADSRCPRGVQCIQAGEAVAIMEGRILKAPPESFDVHLTSDSLADRVFDGYRIRMVDLDPYPVAGAPRDTSAYVGTFMVHKR
jgi:hypothetical protein